MRDVASGIKPPARAAKASYRRNLPHLQVRDRTLFVTFATYRRWELPEPVRGLVLSHVLHDHGVKYELHAAVVMPDHVHMLLSPLRDDDGNTYGQAEILNSIKGAAAHSVNRALHRTGRVWQDESFARIVRSDEDVREKGEYICANPVRAGLVLDEDAYPYLWPSWVPAA